MTMRSIDQLERALDEDLAWRKRELTTVKAMLDNSRTRPHERTLLLRAAICILYAHWEGFIKDAAARYVSFVATRGLRYRNLSPNFVALGLRREIRRAGQSDSPIIHTGLVVKLLSDLGDHPDSQWENTVNTRSNLDSRTLAEILTLVGLEATEYLLKGLLVDGRLVANRNRVVHGTKVEIDYDDYTELHSQIIFLVERFRTDIQNAAVTEQFRLQ